MKIFIAGATGRVGTLLTHDLLQDGHEIIAGARHPERVEKNDHIIPVKFDLHESVAEMTEAIKGADAITSQLVQVLKIYFKRMPSVQLSNASC